MKKALPHVVICKAVKCTLHRCNFMCTGAVVTKTAATFAAFFQKRYLCTRTKRLLKFYASGQIRRVNSRNVYVEFQIYLSYAAFCTCIHRFDADRRKEGRERANNEGREETERERGICDYRFLNKIIIRIMTLARAKS